MARSQRKKCVVFSKEELEAMELAMHYVDGEHGINKRMDDIALGHAHEKVAKALGL